MRDDKLVKYFALFIVGIGVATLLFGIFVVPFLEGETTLNFVTGGESFAIINTSEKRLR